MNPNPMPEDTAVFGPTAAEPTSTDTSQAVFGPCCRTAALSYLESGLRPVPLLPAGSTRVTSDGTTAVATGKEPIGRDWGCVPATRASLEEVYDRHPDAGVGLALGLVVRDGRAASGVIDLEVDDPELAGPTLTAIFGPQGPPATAGFASTRGRHDFYRLSPDQAERLRRGGIDQATLDGKAERYRVRLAGLEVRLGTLDAGSPRQTQSAAPPTATLAADGRLGPPRVWDGPTWDFAPVPETLIAYLLRHFGRPTAPPRKAGHGFVYEAPPPPEPGHDLDPADLFLSQLDRMRLKYEKLYKGWVAQCPLHFDRRPSLSVSTGDDGRLLLHCFVCGGGPEVFPRLLAAAGLSLHDAFPPADAPRPVRRRPDLAAAGWSRPRPEPTDEELRKWRRRHEVCVRLLEARPDRLRELADRLGISVESLEALEVGWREDRHRDESEGIWVGSGNWAWTFPERDGRDRVVGLLRRYEDPDLGKRTVRGSRRGLYLPRGWRERPGPLLLCEGASDTAAAWDAGLAALGRPNASSGAVVADLITLLEGDPRSVVVAADEDASGVGRRGAEDLARRLVRARSGPVSVLPPLPPGVKDIRALLAAERSIGEGAYHG